MPCLNIWIEIGWDIHKFRHHFGNSSVLIAQLVYPVDIFVLLQPYADQLGLSDWDTDDHAMYLYFLRDRPPSQTDEEKHLSSLLQDQVNLDELCKEEVGFALGKMAYRGWNDVILVRDVSKRKLAIEQELWSVMEGISSFALA